MGKKSCHDTGLWFCSLIASLAVIVGIVDSMARMLENNDGLLFSLVAVLREEATFLAGGNHLLKIFLQKLEKKEKRAFGLCVPIGLHGLALLFWCLTVVLSAH